MPMTTEQSLIGGREVNGEPKKLAEVEVHRDGDRRLGAHRPHGLRPSARSSARISGTRDNYETGEDRLLVQAVTLAARQPASSTRTRSSSTARRPSAPGCTRSIDGELILKEAPLDPMADLVVRRMVDLNWTERASTQVGRIIGPVPRAEPRALHPPALRRPLGAGGQAMSDRYTIISADAHAGLPCEEYRPYLDAAYHAAVRRVPGRAPAPTGTSAADELRLHHGVGDGERRGPARRLGHRAARQGARRRRGDRRGHVRRRRRHHRHGLPAVRRRPLRRGHRRSRAGLRRRPRPQPLPGRDVRPQPRAPRRHRPGAHHPRSGTLGGRDRVAGRAARHPRGHGADHVARPARPTTIPTTTRSGPRARRPASRCTPTRARRRRTSTTGTSGSTWPRWCGGRPVRCGTCSSRARSSASPDSSSW